MKTIKTIRSYAEHARFLAELDESKARRIMKPQGFPRTPYSYSQDCVVEYWNNKPIVIAETAHRKYEVIELTGVEASGQNAA